MWRLGSFEVDQCGSFTRRCFTFGVGYPIAVRKATSGRVVDTGVRNVT
jgi:hypothetical protein